MTRSEQLSGSPHLPVPARIRNSGRRGFASGLATAWIMVKIMVPTIVLVQILRAAGILEILSSAAAPFMKYFGLPGEAALALITGAVVNIYACIAVAVNIPMTAKSMTILAVMVLIAHNLIVETAVQSKAGTPAALMLAVRLSASWIAGLVFAAIIPDEGTFLNLAVSTQSPRGVGQVILSNAVSLAKIAIIIITLLLLTEILREFGVMDRFMTALNRPMRVLGMDRKTSFIAAVGLVLGLTYGAGLIIDEAKKNPFTRREILATNVFLGTNHALIEDSLLFAVVGASLPWIVLGRLAFGSVYLRAVMPVIKRCVKDEPESIRLR
ncbi:MAG: hypothetical protein JSV26_02690 [bacterium]|nr:MAG: hypothetical protein JSV26_02690 [bacterium]